MSFALFVIAVVVYRDARRFRLESPDEYSTHIRLSPVWWTAAALLFPYVLPFYYGRRRSLLAACPPGPETSPQRLAAIDGAGVITAWALPSAIILSAAALITTYEPSSALIVNTLGSCAGLAALVLCVALVTKPHGMWTYPEALSLAGGRIGPIASVPLGAVVGLGLVGAVTLIDTLSGPAEGPSAFYLQVSEASQTELVVFVVAATLLGPILEELVYRGWAFRVASTFWSTQTAIIVISLYFWLDHAPSRQSDPIELRAIAVAAVTFTVLRAWTGSVVAPIVAHLVYNAALLAVLMTAVGAAPGILPEDPAEQEAFFEEMLEEQPSHPVALNDLAWLLATREPEHERDLDRALELVNKSLRYEPGNLATLDTKSEILWQLGRKDEALEIARHLVVRDPTSDFFRERLERYGVDPGETKQPSESALDLADQAMRAGRYAEAGQYLSEARALAAEGGGGGGRFARAYKMEEKLRAAAVANPNPEDAEPLLRRNPAYPADAQREGIEGWVYLEFTVTKDGRTRDIVVLDADPKEIFDEAAVEAVRGYIYRPRGVDGVAVDREGVQIVLSFDIQ